MDPSPRQTWFKFDGTVNWPLIISVAAVVLGTIAFGNKIVGQVDTLTVLMASQSEETKKLKESVDNIRLDMAKQDGLRTKVEDHENRIRVLEAK